MRVLLHGASWKVGVLIGLLAGFVVSTAITLYDWVLNPSGIFHNEHGTDWAIVADTAFSWFWPVALVVMSATVIFQTARRYFQTR